MSMFTNRKKKTCTFTRYISIFLIMMRIYSFHTTIHIIYIRTNVFWNGRKNSKNVLLSIYLPLSSLLTRTRNSLSRTTCLFYIKERRGRSNASLASGEPWPLSSHQQPLQEIPYFIYELWYIIARTHTEKQDDRRDDLLRC